MYLTVLMFSLILTLFVAKRTKHYIIRNKNGSVGEWIAIRPAFIVAFFVCLIPYLNWISLVLMAIATLIIFGYEIYTSKWFQKIFDKIF